MTPEAVVHRYLEICNAVDVDRDALIRLIVCDADLARRWLTILGCEASEAAIARAVRALDDATLRTMSEAQAWSVTTAVDSARLNLHQWRNALRNSFLAEDLAGKDADLGLRALLGVSGVSVPGDPALAVLLRFRGTAPELLEDAGTHQQVFCVVDHFELHGKARAKELALNLLSLHEPAFDSACERADLRCRRTMQELGLIAEPDIDWSRRLWLHQQVRLLAAMLAVAQSVEDLRRHHRLASMSLFGYVPGLLLLDEDAQSLTDGEQHIALDSQTSVIARTAREREPGPLADEQDSAVADRLQLQVLGSREGLAYPVVTATQTMGVLVFALDEDIHATDEDGHDFAMQLYAHTLANNWIRAAQSRGQSLQLLERYRETEHKRLREVVHEANNPLSIVRNYLHILELRLQHEPSVVEQLELIGDELRRASEIVQSARDMSDPDQLPDATTAQLAPFDANAALRRAIDLHSGYAEEHYVSLVGELHEGEMGVVSDENKLQQILSNLLKNAIEACRRGDQVTVVSSVGVYRQGRRGVELAVRDTGTGIADEVLQRLFEPKHSTKGGDHAGLGLHIVGRLVEELDASLDVRTSHTTGTSFVLFLPRQPI
ncbi:MAG: HAMP domain-containing sensor histidine kinase [Pseudomonadales bacterium]|nr:HAMP domain-containing sensor histidine kinase [Pseudomonadales bacterium]MDP6472958.1 HAMP domain-containing sensor histidine kinase [Pseudomonadales bacterium]MDP6826286.1 HAMP domain-containing sensor histidine kinase [Pseudomonadales bacterium]MDP6972798.1 HAMP domain-containing sensor histidine kinase [Pseudomonadales bacterium]